MVSQFEIHEPPTSQKIRSRLWLIQGWRKNATCGAIATALVLLFNVILLIWSSGKPVVDGFHTIYSGSCGESKKRSTLCHLAINVLSTILLAAGNVGMQCLIAPTRRDIDRAHSEGAWMHVGVLSMRNILHIPRQRKFVCYILVLSSIPLHLFYNSVIFIRSSANDYVGIFVTNDFLHGGGWAFPDGTDWANSITPEGSVLSGSDLISVVSATTPSADPKIVQVATALRNSLERLERLDIQRCLELYSTSFLSTYSNVIMVTNSTDTNNSIIAHFSYEIKKPPDQRCSVCSPSLSRYCSNYDTDYSYERCESYNSTTEWDFHYYSNYTVQDTEGQYETGTSMDASSNPAHVNYCMALPSEEKCSVALSRSLLVVVVISNTLKLFCLLYLLLRSKWQPLITVGDAISEFLRHSDDRTAGAPCLTYKEAQSGMWAPSGRPESGWDPLEIYTRRWFSTTPKWFYGASYARWGLVMTFCLAFWTTALGLMLGEIHGRYSEGKISLSTFGQADPEYLFATGSSAGTDADQQTQRLLTNVMLANLPQLLISLLYILYSSIITSMFLSHEWLSYARRHKGLRVSVPQGSQRSTFWLTIPLRYGIPLTAIIALLHWTVSESVFLARFDAYDVNLERNPASDINTCGWSPPAVIASLAISAVLLLILIILAARKYPSGMPLASSCSAAISAACQRSIYDDIDVITKPVRFGVLKDVTNVGRNHVGFSAREVQPLEEGATYGDHYQMQARRAATRRVNFKDRRGSDSSLLSLPPEEGVRDRWRGDDWLR